MYTINDVNEFAVCILIYNKKKIVLILFLLLMDFSVNKVKKYAYYLVFSTKKKHEIKMINILPETFLPQTAFKH